ncbi:MAG: FAD-dependent oxidoreductase [Rhodothermales bacterium]|nr:FAD-dependent oxidoreductase [Rhodothermales bacterium]
MSRYDYDVAVLGAGAAGLTAAGIAANFGAKTLMVERDRLGGDCTWTGCVPSKTILKAAKVTHQTRHASRYGLADHEPAVPFERVIAHVHAVRQEVYHDADDPAIYEGFGVDVRHGSARFTGPHHLLLTGADGGEAVVSFRLAIIATGGRAAPPPIPGLDGVGYLTNETLFEIGRQPQRLLVLGAGPIGMEMGQAFQRLGSAVTVVDRGDRPLRRDDPDHARRLQAVLEEEGVRFCFGASVERVEEADGEKRLHVTVGGEARVLTGDALLVATGRRPNTEDLGLAEAGVVFTERGIRVDDRCQTSQKHVWAVGDVTGEYQLTHMSEHMAKVATSNAVLKVPATVDRRHVPWTTFADPELAHLGASEQELRERGERYEVYRFPYAKVDRAVTESDAVGEIKVFATKWRGKILGASVLGDRAGELISLYAVAMRNGVTLRSIADTIHPYPTYGLGARRAADQWYARKLYPRAVRLLQRVRGFRGTVPPPPDPDRIV